MGNRTTKDSVTYTVNAVSEVTALSDGTSFTYDDNGNRTQKTKGTDTWAYTYDYANRLIEMEKNSVTLEEYVYDGDGKRIQLAKDSVITTYVYSGFSVLCEENTTGTATYIYGPKGRLAKRTTISGETNTFYYHNDHLDSTRLVTDDSKNIVTAVTYHPFGEPYSVEGSHDYLFTGKEKDSTDLYYYGARYYDPDLGRFLTRDPKGGINQYSYCRNNPLRYVDPDGCENKDWITDDTDYTPGWVYKRHPHVVHWCGIWVEDDPIWFGIFCVGAGIVLAIVLTGGTITFCFPNAGALATSFIKWLAPALLKFLAKHKWTIIKDIILLIISLMAADYLNEQEAEEIMDGADPEECASFLKFLDKFRKAWGTEVIKFEYNEDGTYTVKFDDDTTRTFKCIDGEWVEIPTSSEDGGIT